MGNLELIGQGDDRAKLSKCEGDSASTSVEVYNQQARMGDVNPSQTAAGMGGWRAACFILAMEASERLAFYSVGANLVTYLMFELHVSLPKAVTTVTNWIGAAYVLGIPGGFMADSYLGRFLTIAIYSACYILGLGLMTLSATARSLRPPACDVLTRTDCQGASGSQWGLLLAGLYLIAIGTGGIKPCVSAFGADQLGIFTNTKNDIVNGYTNNGADIDTDSDNNNGIHRDGGAVMIEAEEEAVQSWAKASFFNWFFFSVNVGALFAFTVVVYVQDNVGWGPGFGIPLASMVLSLAVLLYGMPLYRYQPPAGSPLSRFARVLLAAFRNRNVSSPHQSHFPDQHHQYTKDSSSSSSSSPPPPSSRRLMPTHGFRWLDKAAAVKEGRGKAYCTAAQVEELKLFLRILPVLATTVFLWTGYTQLLTFFVKQGTTLDRNLGAHFQIPPASLPIFSVINALLVLPFYDRVVVPVTRRFRRKGAFSPLQRMGFGLFVSIISMVAAALVERRRLRVVAANPGAPALPMSIFWLVPQYFLVGLAEIFTYVGQLEFFYGEVSPGMRSLSTSLFIAELGVGSWVSSLLVTLVERITGSRVGHGWILDDINSSKIDHFYWLLAVLGSINFLLFLVAASRHRYNKLQSQVASVGAVRVVVQPAPSDQSPDPRQT